jgi:hypothetical protein
MIEIRDFRRKLGQRRPAKIHRGSMFESHKDLEITGGEMGCVHGRFSADAGQFGVPAQEQGELKTIVDSTRADIVVEPEAAATS